MTGCICEPLIGGRRQVIVRPMAILAARCAYDSRHVSGGGQNEFDGTGIQTRRRIGRRPWGDMVLARGQDERRDLDPRQADRGASERDAAGLG